jgi:hypothetical protein
VDICNPSIPTEPPSFILEGNGSAVHCGVRRRTGLRHLATSKWGTLREAIRRTDRPQKHSIADDRALMRPVPLSESATSDVDWHVQQCLLRQSAWSGWVRGTGESGEAVEEVRQHRCIAFVLRPRNRVPLPADASLPLNGGRGVVGHDVQLALVLPESGDDVRRDVLAIDSNPDLLVRDSAHVVGLRRVEGVEAEFGSLAVPSFEHRLWHRAVCEPLEPGPVQRTQPPERLVGGRADRDVVGMAEVPSGPNVTTTAGSSSSRTLPPL